jgi:hypothetical protein
MTLPLFCIPDLSIAQTDREAAQHKPPAQKRPRKTTVLNDKTNLPTPTPDLNRAANENEEPSTMIKKKAGPGSRGKGKEKRGVKEEEVLVLCERLDESLESHISESPFRVYLLFESSNPRRS